MWLSTTGIGYNVGEISARMPDAPVDSWRMFFDPAVLARFQDCGVAMLDAPINVVGAALAYLGKNPNSESPQDLAAAEQLLYAVRPFVRSVNSAQYYGDLANADLCLVLGWSGDVITVRERASEAGKSVSSPSRSPGKARSATSTCWPSRQARPTLTTPTCSSTTCCARRWPPGTPTPSCTPTA